MVQMEYNITKYVFIMSIVTWNKNCSVFITLERVFCIYKESGSS